MGKVYFFCHKCGKKSWFFVDLKLHTISRDNLVCPYCKEETINIGNDQGADPEGIGILFNRKEAN